MSLTDDMRKSLPNPLRTLAISSATVETTKIDLMQLPRGNRHPGTTAL
jgi:hypothetical protein